jgi:integrase
MAIHRLKQRFVDTVKQPGRYADGGGLYLQVTKTGSKSWVFIYSRRPFGKPGQSEMGLGSVGTYSLDEAQELARKCRQQIKDRIDPLAAREEKRQAREREKAKDAKFEEIAARYIEYNSKERREPWAFGTIRQTKMIVNHYCKSLHGWPLADIEVWQLAAILNTLRSKPTMAATVLMRMDHIFKIGKAKGCRKDDPTDLDGDLGELVPWLKPTERPDSEPMAALPWKRVPGFMARLLAPRDKDPSTMTIAEAEEVTGIDRSNILVAIHQGRLRAKQDEKVADQRNAPWYIKPEDLIWPIKNVPSERPLVSNSAYVLAFQILTATRPGEARYARWSECPNFENDKIWTLPWQRIKPRRKMRVKADLDVPLSPEAIAILKNRKAQQEADGMWGKTDFIFAHTKVFAGRGVRLGFPPSDTAVRGLKDRKLLPDEEADLHGFRTSFASWSDDHSFDRDAKEMALTHSIGNSVERLYSRHAKRFPQRVDLMLAWSKFCMHGELPGDIIPFRRAKHERSKSNARD